MAVSKVGTPIATRVTASPLAMAWGTSQNRTAGNLLLIAVTVSAVTSDTAISTPSGWNKLPEVVNGVTRTAWYWAIALGADAAPSFTSTLSGTAAMVGIPYELSGTDKVNPIVTAATGSTVSASTTISVTTAGNVPVAGCAGLVAIGLFTSAASTRTWTPGSGWTNDASDNATSSRIHLMTDSVLSPGSNQTLNDNGTYSTTPTSTAAQIIIVQPPVVALNKASVNSCAVTRASTW